MASGGRSNPLVYPDRRAASLQQPGLTQPLGQARSIRGVDPAGPVVLLRPVRLAAAAGKHGFAAGQLPDGHRATVVRVRVGELTVRSSSCCPSSPTRSHRMPGNSVASRARLSRLWSRPLRNHRSCVGPQSVSSRAPAGYSWRDRKRVSVGATFHAPVERYITGAPGCASVSRSSSTAMPGTGRRACSSSTNVFHAANSGRGSAVTMTVSSTSETMPKSHIGVHDEHGRGGRFRLIGAHGDGVPSRRQIRLQHNVDDAAAVCGDLGAASRRCPRLPRRRSPERS